MIPNPQIFKMGPKAQVLKHFFLTFAVALQDLVTDCYAVYTYFSYGCRLLFELTIALPNCHNFLLLFMYSSTARARFGLAQPL